MLGPLHWLHGHMCVDMFAYHITYTGQSMGIVTNPAMWAHSVGMPPTMVQEPRHWPVTMMKHHPNTNICCRVHDSWMPSLYHHR